MSVIEMTETEMTENKMIAKVARTLGGEEMNADSYNIELRKKYNKIWRKLMDE
jgi:hypothetical protein